MQSRAHIPCGHPEQKGQRVIASLFGDNMPDQRKRYWVTKPKAEEKIKSTPVAGCVPLPDLSPPVSVVMYVRSLGPQPQNLQLLKVMGR